MHSICARSPFDDFAVSCCHAAQVSARTSQPVPSSAPVLCAFQMKLFRILVTCLVFALRGHAKAASSARVTAPPPESCSFCEDGRKLTGPGPAKVSPHSFQAWVAGTVCVHSRKYLHRSLNQAQEVASAWDQVLYSERCRQGFPAGPTALRPRSPVSLLRALCILSGPPWEDPEPPSQLPRV